MIPLMKPVFDPRRWPRKAGLWAGVIAGVVSVPLLLWIAVSCSVGLIASSLPRLWSGVRVWLVPPYLFITVHLMIVVIWKLSEHKAHADHRPEEEKPPPPPLPEVPLADKPQALAGKALPVVDLAEYEAATPAPVLKSGGSVPEPSSDASCLTTESDAVSTTSSRVEIRKSVKVPMPSVESPAEEEDDESLEARWKAIIAAGAAPVVRSPPPANRSEPGNEELNRRCDAFIQKNYDQIRLQQYTGMVNRA